MPETKPILENFNRFFVVENEGDQLIPIWAPFENVTDAENFIGTGGSPVPADMKGGKQCQG